MAALGRLYAALQPPRSLRDLGLAEDDLAEAASLVAQAAPDDNPVPVTEGVAARLLRAAWAGETPQETTT